MKGLFFFFLLCVCEIVGTHVLTEPSFSFPRESCLTKGSSHLNNICRWKPRSFSVSMGAVSTSLILLVDLIVDLFLKCHI
jgi:hypothetical protein